MPPHPHCHWRDLQEWRAAGLEMSTSSDVAAKMFDASVTQMVGFYDDPSLGGLKTTVEKMIEADPHFVLGHVIKLGSSGKRISNDNSFASEIYKLASLAEHPHVKPWERKHALAVKHQALDEMEAATFLWEEILIDHPRDMLALTFLIMGYGIQGEQYRFHGTCGAALNYWKPHMPFYGNVIGMQSYGYEEANFYSEAERLGLKALGINSYDVFAHHSVSHVHEMRGDSVAGIDFMLKTENNWSDTNLACHLYWHWSLYHMEAREHEVALSIYDTQIRPRMTKTRGANHAVDASILMARLGFEGQDVQNRWDEIFDVGKAFTKDHKFAFYDAPILFSCYGAKQLEVVKDMFESVRYSASTVSGDICAVYREVGIPVMEAVVAFEDQDFSRVVEILKPIRYKLIRLGGSHAQRDIIILMLIHAALQSTRTDHQQFAKALLLERKSLKRNTPMAEYLLQQFMANH